jgi:hypothetical protein
MSHTVSHTALIVEQFSDESCWQASTVFVLVEHRTVHLAQDLILEITTFIMIAQI